MPSKHTTYFEVLDALGQDGCPVCRLDLRAVSRYLDALSYEGVNDPGLRRQLRAARGFCNRHAWQFAEEVHDGLGTAIIYRDILTTMLQILSRAQSSRSARGHPSRAKHMEEAGDALALRLMPEGRCPACQSLMRASHRYLETLLAHLEDTELRDRLLASAGLCLPHLAAALPLLQTASGLSLLTAVSCRSIAALRAGSAPGAPADVEAVAAVAAGRLGALPAERSPLESQYPTAAGRGSQAAPDRSVAAHGDGCPVCQAALAGVDSLLAEIAAAWDAQGGSPGGVSLLSLCNVHAWRLVAKARVPARGIWQAGAQEMLARLSPEAIPDAEATAGWWRFLSPRAQSPVRQAGMAAAAKLLPQGMCPVCRRQAELEQWAASAWLGNLRLDSRPASDRCAQPCLPHFRLSLRLLLPRQPRQLVVASQADAVKALRAELDEYIRKQDYRFRHEPLGTEVDSPWRAVAHVAGVDGLCGICVPRDVGHL